MAAIGAANFAVPATFAVTRNFADVTFVGETDSGFGGGGGGSCSIVRSNSGVCQEDTEAGEDREDHNSGHLLTPGSLTGGKSNSEINFQQQKH